MIKPNPVEFELPYEEALLLDVRREWIVEQKMDGIRAVLQGGVLKTYHNDVTPPGPVPSGWGSLMLDGCLVEDIYYVFDLLMLDGEDARSLPLHERRTLLRSLGLPSWCRLVPSGKNISEFLEAVVQDGGEGVVLKSLLQPYGQAEWIKVERVVTEDFVVMAIHEEDRCVTVGQFEGNKLSDRGTVFLGSLLPEAWPGQVVEVAVQQRDTAGMFKNARFIRFRPDKLAVACKAFSP